MMRDPLDISRELRAFANVARRAMTQYETRDPVAWTAWENVYRLAHDAAAQLDRDYDNRQRAAQVGRSP